MEKLAKCESTVLQYQLHREWLQMHLSIEKQNGSECLHFLEIHLLHLKFIIPATKGKEKGGRPCAFPS